MKNRRNYYRLLHVQPDAPVAVIKSSYCALMLKMKQHPDLGGDHETAALINEAHAVLTNINRRAEYDHYLESREPRANFGNTPFYRHKDERSSACARNEWVQSSIPLRCPFCHAPYQAPITSGMRCTNCDSPLSPAIRLKLESTDQRAFQRFERNGEIRLLMQHAHKSFRAWLQDLSPTGMSFMATELLDVDQVIRIDGAILSAVARVVNCGHRRSRACSMPMVGVEFLTLEFAQAQGTFVSKRI